MIYFSDFGTSGGGDPPPPTSPTDPVAGYFLWLKADSLSLADGAAVSAWADQSGNGYDPVQSTGTKQPTYVANWQNGKPAINFDGSNDNLVKAFGTTYSQPNTVFAVVEVMASPVAAALPWIDGVNSTQRHWMGNAGHISGKPLSMWAGTAFIGPDAFADEPDGAYPLLPSVYSAHYNGSSSRMSRESRRVTGNPGTQAWSGITIGSRWDNANFFNVRVAEIIAYNSDLSEADAAETEAYLTTKYATRPFFFQFLERPASSAGAYQGVATDGAYLYCCGGNSSGASADDLYKRNTDGTLVTSRDTASDGSATHTQLSGVFYNPADDRLYCTANDFVTNENSGSSWPQIDPHGWVYVYEASDLSFVEYHSLGGWISEGLTLHDGSWWEVNASDHNIRQYDSSFTLIDTYALPGTDIGSPYWQGIVVIDDVFYLNPHNQTGPAKMQAYTFNGTGFTLVDESFGQPNQDCSQGTFYDGENVWWAERIVGSAGNIVKSKAVLLT